MIEFKRITFQNFLSSGNVPVTINLNEDKTSLIHGINGSGKSTILDALSYALFNKPYRSVNLPQLINSSNKKGLLTEVEFDIGPNNYVVCRGMRPKIFKLIINGTEIDNKASNVDNQKNLEQNILKMNHKTFSQVVILGSGSWLPFMQLPLSARRECVEEFLDIKVFSSMSLLAKEKLRSLKENLHEVKGDVSNLQYKIELQKDRVQELMDRKETDTQNLQEELSQITKDYEDKKSLIKGLREHHDSLSLLTDKREEVFHKKIKWEKMMSQLDSKLKQVNRDINFYNTHDNCPTCDQLLTEETKERHLKSKKDESTEVTSAQKVSKTHIREYSHMLTIYDQRIKYLQHIKESVQGYENDIGHLRQRGDILALKLRDTKSDNGSLEREMGKLDVLHEDLETLNKKKDSLVTSVSEHEAVVNLLKDNGIKTQVIRKYVPIMNKLIRKFLQDLDFPINFTLDEEFKESISSPMYQDFSYSSFSEGQKSRIDLALLLTWREIGRLKNSINVSLFALDEVFSSSLDQTGKDLLFSLLKYGMDDKQRILVVDHTLDAQFKEKFDKSIEVSKVKGFSTYQ